MEGGRARRCSLEWKQGRTTHAFPSGSADADATATLADRAILDVTAQVVVCAGLREWADAGGAVDHQWQSVEADHLHSVALSGVNGVNVRRRPQDVLLAIGGEKIPVHVVADRELCATEAVVRDDQEGAKLVPRLSTLILTQRP